VHKLKLDLDQLAVDSFDTNPSESAPRGTVQGFSHVCGPTRFDPTCYVTCGTCDLSCGTCGASCGYTCGCGATAYTCNDPSCATCLTYCGQESCIEYCP
jgi:hypothetical protein